MAELHKTPTAFTYTSKLFDFKLSEFSTFLKQQKNNPDLNEKMIKGFTKLLECLDLFLDTINISSAENCQIKTFGSVTLTTLKNKNKNILRATNKFFNNPWFSNIAVAMDDSELFEYQTDGGTCYAQVYANYS
jgi:hypothetical protein